MNTAEINALHTAIADSIALDSTVTVTVSNIEAASVWLRRNNWDVDWDNINGAVAIFGSKPTKSDEADRWVLRLVECVNA